MLSLGFHCQCPVQRVSILQQVSLTALVLMQFIGGDQDKDVAVLQLQCPEEKLHDLKRISLGNSSNLLVGQKVYAIGNPFGLDHTLTGQCIPLPHHLHHVLC